ncbi:MAG: NAD-dependent epimerase/dehydratase family protein [Candidatus Sabulitectum sp.]|nr:NAD-dependent epimerase/dehydratase family protein [Candidatus Sabulitectum sp.]
MKVFLTGASGFIGRFLAGKLVEDGHTVIAAVRSTSDISLIPEGCRLVTVDIMSEKELLPYLSDIDVIFHVAGAVKACSSQEFDQINAGTTAAIVNAAEKSCPQALFIYMSSQAAAGPSGTKPITSYGRSKLLGEQVVTGFPRFIIVRPPAALGQGDKPMQSLYLWAKRGISGVIGSGKTKFCIISVHDLCDLAALLVDCPDAEGKILQPSWPELISWDSFHSAMEKATGKKILKIRVPDLAVHMAGVIAEITARITGLCPMVDREKARELTAVSWLNLQHEVEEITGWKPKLSPEETIARAMGSLKKQRS